MNTSKRSARTVVGGAVRAKRDVYFAPPSARARLLLGDKQARRKTNVAFLASDHRIRGDRPHVEKHTLCLCGIVREPQAVQWSGRGS